MINYQLAMNSEVRIDVFNQLGQKINCLFSGMQATGNHQLVWDGTDFDGDRVASGLYFYQLAGNNFSIQRKMLFIQ